MIRNRIGIAALLLAYAMLAGGIATQAEEVNEEWIEQIREIAPSEPIAEPQGEHRALIFSLMTGYKHHVTPFTTAVVRLLGDKTGVYDLVVSDDVAMFKPENIKQFDLIFLNNNCSKGDRRDLFFDATGNKEKAEMLEESLISHIKTGNGLVALHGAIVMQNRSPEFSEMVGGSFDFHPRQQQVSCIPVDPDHPLVAPFDGEPFVHKDEPYVFNNAYTNFNFRPLLEMDVDKLKLGKHEKRVRAVMPRYVAWIKPYGEGRVFYCSPSHNTNSFKQPELLEFMLGGIQYAAGDIDCDDSPVK